MTAPQAEWAQRAVVIGIDPDTQASGVGLALGGRLSDVRVVPTDPAHILAYAAEYHRYLAGALVVIEMPAARGRQHVRRADLLALAIVVGQWAQELGREDAEVHFIEASPGWKGSVPKAVTEGRLLGGTHWPAPVLAPGEREQIPQVERGRVTKEQRGEMIDAVGICMWALGRYR